MEFEKTYFEQNEGTLVGGAMAEEKSLLFGQGLYFYDNVAEEHATALYYTGNTNGLVDDCKFYQKAQDDKFLDYLLDKSVGDERVSNFKLPRAGAIEVDGKTTVIITSSDFQNNSASYGAILASDQGNIDAKFCSFQANAAYNGGGVFVQGGRGSYARVMNSVFMDNTARYGGAMVVAGEMIFGSHSGILFVREWFVLD